VTYKCLEIVSGLGMGGAEKTFLDRILWAPENLETKIIDTIPGLLAWDLPPGISYTTCHRRSFGYLKRLRSQIDAFAPHVVIVRTPLDLIALAGLRKFSSYQWKLIYEAHSTKLSQSKFVSLILMPFHRIAIKASHLVIAVSKSVSEGEQCFGSKKLAVHYFGATARTRNDVQSKNLTFIFVGRFVALKQPVLLLDAIREVYTVLQDAGVTVRFIGKGPLEGEIREYVKRNKVDEVVRIMGYVSDLDSIYSESDYLISTSKFEGLPITFFEAKQHGLRVITTPSSGDFDVLGEEDEILPNFARKSIADALVSAVQMGKLTTEVRKSIQVKNRWMSAEVCAEKYYKLIEAQISQTA
jgi:glycosyltransferase involved in cell wall biosynthesis